MRNSPGRTFPRGLLVALGIVATAAGCLDTGAPLEKGTTFLEEMTILDPSVFGEGGPPADFVPDYMFSFEMIHARPDTPWVPPEDPALWADFLDQHPDFLEPAAFSSEGAGALPTEEPHDVTFSWGEFLGRLGGSAKQKEGVVLASAGLLAIGIPVPPGLDPTDVVTVPAGVVWAVVGSLTVGLIVTHEALTDPAFGAMVSYMWSTASERARDLGRAITAQLERTGVRPSDDCATRVAKATALTITQGNGVICHDGTGWWSAPSLITAPRGITWIYNVGTLPVNMAGDIPFPLPAGTDLWDVVRRRNGDGWIPPFSGGAAIVPLSWSQRQLVFFGEGAAASLWFMNVQPTP